MLLIYFNHLNIVIKYIITLLILIGLTNGHPLKKKHCKDAIKTHETTLPNGTVVGEYLYKDAEGNPIKINYYADNCGYGVEMKTFKISSFETNSSCQSNGTKTVGEVATLHHKVMHSSETTKPNAPIEELIKDMRTKAKTQGKELEDYYKTDSTSTYKKDADYEIFVTDKLKSPKKCGQEKVHVYYEKNKRKTRNSVNELDAVRYCEQFA